MDSVLGAMILMSFLPSICHTLKQAGQAMNMQWICCKNDRAYLLNVWMRQQLYSTARLSWEVRMGKRMLADGATIFQHRGSIWNKLDPAKNIPSLIIERLKEARGGFGRSLNFLSINDQRCSTCSCTLAEVHVRERAWQK